VVVQVAEAFVFGAECFGDVRHKLMKIRRSHSLLAPGLCWALSRPDKREQKLHH
jgi:hypothetical protein